jgi:hypothetical protein
VKISTGEIGVVVQVHAPDPYRPRVKLLFNREGGRLDLPYERNLWEPPPGSAEPDSVSAPLNPEDYGIDPLSHLGS